MDGLVASGVMTISFSSAAESRTSYLPSLLTVADTSAVADGAPSGVGKDRRHVTVGEQAVQELDWDYIDNWVCRR